MVPGETKLSDVTKALESVGGAVAGAFDQPVPGALTLPALDTRMQHQRPRETPTISIA